jgi:rubrerythrin
MKDFSALTEREVLALAIALEEEDSRTYSDLANAMHGSFPGTAKMLEAMAQEEDGHRHRLLDLYRSKFGDHIPLIRRQDVVAPDEPGESARPGRAHGGRNRALLSGGGPALH